MGNDHVPPQRTEKFISMRNVQIFRRTTHPVAELSGTEGALGLFVGMSLSLLRKLRGMHFTYATFT